MTNLARFTINGSPSEDSNGARGYDASVGQTIELQLEQSIGVLAVTFFVPDPAAADAPPSSTGAPQLEFTSNNSNRVTFGSGGTSVLDIAEIELPMSADLDSYVLRATVVTARGEESFDRMLAVRKNGLRKTSVAESTEYSQPGWEVVLNDLIEAFAGAGGPAPGYVQPADPGDDGKVATASAGAIVWDYLSDANVDPAAGIQVSKLEAGDNGDVLTTVAGVPVWAPPTGSDVEPTMSVLYVAQDYAGENGASTGSQAQPFNTWAEALAVINASATTVSWQVIFGPGVYYDLTIPPRPITLVGSVPPDFGQPVVLSADVQTQAVLVEHDGTIPNSGAYDFRAINLKIEGVAAINSGSPPDVLHRSYFFEDCFLIDVLNNSVFSITGKPGIESCTFVGRVQAFASAATVDLTGGNPLEAGGRVDADGYSFLSLYAHELGRVVNCRIDNDFGQARAPLNPGNGVGFFDCTFSQTGSPREMTSFGPPSVVRMDRVSDYSFTNNLWSNTGTDTITIVEAGGSSGGLTPPLDPTEDYAIAVAQSGDLVYDDRSRLYPNGALHLKSLTPGDSLIPVIERQFDGSFGPGITYGNGSWSTVNVGRVWYDASTALAFNNTLNGAFTASPTGKLSFDAAATIQGIVISTATKRGYFVHSTGADALWMLTDLASVSIAPTDSVKIAPTGPGGGPTPSDGVEVSYDATISGRRLTIDDGLVVLNTKPSLAVTVPSSTFIGTHNTFWKTLPPNWLETRTPHTASNNSRSTWRSEFAGQKQVYEYDGIALIGRGAVDDSVINGARVADIVRHYEYTIAAGGTTENVLDITPAELEMWNGSQNVAFMWTLRGVIVGLSAPVWVERKGAVAYRNSPANFVVNSPASYVIATSGLGGTLDLVKTAGTTMTIQVGSANLSWNGAKWYIRLELAMIRGAAVQ